MPFMIKAVYCIRDYGQGYFGYLPLGKDKNLIAIAKIWNELHVLTHNDPNCLMKVDDFETAGAHPQLTAKAEKRDYLGEYLKLALEAPDMGQRPLIRASNVVGLEPFHETDLRFMLRQFAITVAHPKMAGEDAQDRMRARLFDSQGDSEELRLSIIVLSELRDEQYLVSAECAIPFSKKMIKQDGKERAVYPDAYYLRKVKENYELLVQSNLPLDLCCISLKDMIGQMDVATVKSLLPEMINTMRDLQKEWQEKLRIEKNNPNLVLPEIPIGIHLHNTGLAEAASIEAVVICKKMDYCITLDGVECNPLRPDFTGENAWRNTGFASFRAIIAGCKARGIELGFDPYLAKLDDLGALGKIVSEEYSARRADFNLSGGALRACDVPGGAVNTCFTAIASVKIKDISDIGLSQILKLTNSEAFALVGFALQKIGQSAGYTHAVTPGYQNKQHAAINYLKNLIINKRLEPGTPLYKMKAIVLKIPVNEKEADLSVDELINEIEEEGAPLTQEEIEQWVLKDLVPVAKTFFKSKSPAEMMQAWGISTPATVNPHFRAALPLRLVSLTKTVEKPLLPSATLMVEKLYKEGLIKVTDDQKQMVNMIYDDLSDYQKEEKAIEIAKNSHINWALLVGPAGLEDALRYPWRCEPDPTENQENPDRYHFQVQRAKQGKNPRPDALGQHYLQLCDGTRTVEPLYNHTQLLLEQEQKQIWLDVLNIMKTTPGIIHDVNSVDQVVQRIYNDQENKIKEREKTGGRFYFQRSRRLNIALDFFSRELAMLKASALTEEKKVVKVKRQEIESTVILSPMPGIVKSVAVQPGQQVVAGQLLLILEAMKMENAITAANAGVVESVVQAGLNVIAQQLLVGFKKNQENQQTLNTFVEKNTDSEGFIRALNNRIKKVDAEKISLHYRIQKNAQVLEADHEKTKETQSTLSDLEECGYFARPLSLTDEAKDPTKRGKEIHIIANRSVPALIAYAHLKQANYDVRVLYTKADERSRFIQFLKKHYPERLILVESYTHIKEITHKVKEVALANEDATVFIHPLWGLLAEVIEFVAALEALKRDLKLKVQFVGPPSHAMALGDKGCYRDLLASVAPLCNPPYFRLKNYTAAELEAYIRGGFQGNSDIDTHLREYFVKIKATREGDKEIKVAIKADAGGGGMGIEFYTYNDTLSDEENYRVFVALLAKNVAFSEVKFKSGTMVIEKFITGVTWHLEIQVMINDKGVLIYGHRICTPQSRGQKTNEGGATTADYTPEQMNAVLIEAKKIAQALWKRGYRGLGTLEFLVLVEKMAAWQALKMANKPIRAQDNFFIGLELNPRLQVEHAVTQEKSFVETKTDTETGISMSLPLMLLACMREQGLTLSYIMQRDFGMSEGAVMVANKLIKQRIDHVRINSQEVDLVRGGKPMPSYWWGVLWPHAKVFADIAKNGVQMIMAEIGDGTFVSHTGTLCGTPEQILEAGEKIRKIVELGRICMDHDGTVSLGYVLDFRRLLYHPQTDAFVQTIGTKTQDEIFQMIQEGRLNTDPFINHQSLTVSDTLLPGGIEGIFAAYQALKLQEAQALTQKKQVTLT